MGSGRGAQAHENVLTPVEAAQAQVRPNISTLGSGPTLVYLTVVVEFHPPHIGCCQPLCVQ
jgi:hypothetical protein